MLKIRRLIMCCVVIGVGFLILIQPVAHIRAQPLTVTDPLSLCAEGIRLFDAGRIDEALPYLEGGFARRTAIQTANTEQLGYCALALGQLYLDRHEYTAALEALNVANEAFRQGGYQEGLASVLIITGNLYQTRQQYDKAEEAYLSTIRTAQEINDKHTEAAAWNNLGLVLIDRGDLKAAEEAFTKALTLSDDQGDLKVLSHSLSGLSSIYEVKGELVKAQELLEQNILINYQLEDFGAVGIGLNNLGNVYRQQSLFDKAELSFRTAIDVARETGGRVHEATAINNLAAVLADRGQYSGAMNLYTEALVIRKEVGDRLGEGNTLAQIANLQVVSGDYGKATEYIHQALAIFRIIGARREEAMTLGNLASLQQIQGSSLEAMDSYELAIDIFSQLNDKRNVIITMTNLASIGVEVGDYEGAISIYLTCLRMAEEMGDYGAQSAINNQLGVLYGKREDFTRAQKHFTDALQLARKYDNVQGQSTIMINLGSTYEHHGDGRQAEVLFREALELALTTNDRLAVAMAYKNLGQIYEDLQNHETAQEMYRLALENLEGIRASVQGDVERINFIGQYSSIYDTLIKSYHQQGHDELAFAVSERGRARVFLDTISTGALQVSGDAGAELFRQEQGALAEIFAREEAVAQAVALGDEFMVRSRQHDLQAARLQYFAAQSAVEHHGGVIADLINARSQVMFDHQTIQEALDSNEALVSYHIFNDQIMAFVVTRTRLYTTILPVGRNELRSQIQALRLFPNLEDTHPASAQQLYAWLIKPLRIPPLTTHLVIVPHNVLHYLPFAALTDGSRYLIDQYTISLMPSAGSLQLLPVSSDQNSRLPLIVGNPLNTITETSSLPNAQREAEAVAKIYDSTAFLKSEATESVVRNHVTNASIVHIAAHAKFDNLNPFRSAILLAADAEHDGRLEVNEIYQLDLQGVDLVVLSGCETQINDNLTQFSLSPGDDIVSLTRALFFAGTPSVVASLWSVDDKATAMLMERFYQNMRSGMGKARALRQAQIETRAVYPNPYYWSGFALSGDGGEVQGLRIPVVKPQALIIASLVLLALWCSCVFLWISQRTTGKLIGYQKNRPVYAIRPRFSPRARRLGQWGTLTLPLFSFFFAAAAWYLGLW